MRIVFQALILLLTCLSLTVTGQPRDSVEGIHYQPLGRPVPTETPEDVIEVRELFWYGCAECFTLEPISTDYRDGVRGDVRMLRTPVVWNEIMEMHARIYYTALVLDAEDQIHQAAFHALHEENNPLQTEREIQVFFSKNGIDEETFNETWHSDEVDTMVKRAALQTTDYAPNKLPAFIVNGRYRVEENAAVPDHIELNIAVNLVIRRLRDERRSDF